MKVKKNIYYDTKWARLEGLPETKTYDGDCFNSASYNVSSFRFCTKNNVV